MIGGVPAEEVGEADGDSGPEERVAREGALGVVVETGRVLVDLALQDDRHDHSVDGHCLAEDDAGLGQQYLTRFLERMRGALTAAPRMLAPEM